jgi:hypothetical protein
MLQQENNEIGEPRKMEAKTLQGKLFFYFRLDDLRLTIKLCDFRFEIELILIDNQVIENSIVNRKSSNRKLLNV